MISMILDEMPQRYAATLIPSAITMQDPRDKKTKKFSNLKV